LSNFKYSELIIFVKNIVAKPFKFQLFYSSFIQKQFRTKYWKAKAITWIRTS